MKKILTLLVSLIMVFAMVGCFGSKKETPSDETVKEELTTNESEKMIGLITSFGGVNDKSFVQGSWEGILKYAEETGVKHKYYEPTEESTEAFSTAIDIAVKDGANIIISPGFLFETAIYNAQTKYPDVKFVLIDAVPRNGEEEKIGPNTLSVFYTEEESGFLAGYASVKDGFRKLGFMGGIPIAAVSNYGFGYIQGAEYAAKELGLNKGDVEIKYTYTGNFEATPENMNKASSWYNEGTEVIFSCGGNVGASVMKAAENFDKKVIGVDSDQSSESETVITSATKNLKGSVYDILKSIDNGNFVGGISLILNAETNSVVLPMETSRFNSFNSEEYNKIYEKLVNKEIDVKNTAELEKPENIDLQIVDIKVSN